MTRKTVLVTSDVEVCFIYKTVNYPRMKSLE